MNLTVTFDNEYAAYCSKSPKVLENQIIRIISNSNNCHINLNNKNLHQLAFIDISKTLIKMSQYMVSLDISFNILFNDPCVSTLDEVIRSCINLDKLDIEKVSITDKGGIDILKSLCAVNRIKVLNMGSNKLKEGFIDKLINSFKGGKLKSIESLNLSNIKMSEKTAIKIFLPLLEHSNVTELNLSMNCLKHKAGTHILNILSQNQKLILTDLDLSYNPMGMPLLSAIDNELLKRKPAIDIKEVNHEIKYMKIEPYPVKTSEYSIKNFVIEKNKTPKYIFSKNNIKTEISEANEFRYENSSTPKIIGNKSRTSYKDKSDNLNDYKNVVKKIISPKVTIEEGDNKVTKVEKSILNSMNEIEETKNVLKQQIHKLLDVYSSIDRSFNTPKTNILKMAKELVNENKKCYDTLSNKITRSISNEKFNKKPPTKFIQKGVDSCILQKFGINNESKNKSIIGKEFMQKNNFKTKHNPINKSYKL